MASEPGSPERGTQNLLRVPHYSLDQALINDPNIQSGLLHNKSSYKCLSVDPPDQVDGHTLRQENKHKIVKARPKLFLLTSRKWVL